MKRLSYLMLSLLSIIMFGCSETEQPYVGYIVVEDAVLPAVGGSTTLTANTDISSPITIEVAKGADWCTASISGKEITVTVDQANTDIDSRKATVYVRCGYREETFTVTQQYEGQQYEVDWSDWTATGNSVQENDGGGYPSLFKEERTTFWHSNYGAPVPLPYEITVDMQEEHTCFMFRIGRRAYGTVNYPSVKTMEIYCSTDNENFTKVGGFTFALPWTAPDGTVVTGNSALVPGFEDVTLEKPVTARYVKLVITETNTANNTCQVSYFKAYEKN